MRTEPRPDSDEVRSAPSEGMTIRATLLGIAQDGGLPQAGCACENCAAAWSGRLPRQHVSSLSLTAGQDGPWVIDVTPDIKDQLQLLGQSALPDKSAPEPDPGDLQRTGPIRGDLLRTGRRCRRSCAASS